MEKEDLDALNKLKNKYNYRTVMITGISLLNIFFIASKSKTFLQFSSFKKFLAGGTIFSGTYCIGMHSIKKEADELNDKFITKYRDVIENIPEKA